MRRIGLLGGMSWESSTEYYRMLNEEVRRRLGGLHSADCLLRSVDFADIEQLQLAGDWDAVGARLADEAQALVAGGAEIVLLCANTMHKVAPAISSSIDVPFVHIVDTVAEAIVAAKVARVGLLGTSYTMEGDFYVGRLRERHGLEVLIPEEAERRLVHRVIFEELCLGVIDETSRRAYLEVIDSLVARGAQAILLGCTEIGLLITPSDCDVLLFDSAHLHAQRAVELALET
jgi:aspartate racemase